ncbi:MAG: hypothetical protein N5P05_001335 [Chroococcopsis gigantea SAG 12.99]|nr:hypothetical protein [Chroococcopsis gigantea SAG 12.99]
MGAIFTKLVPSPRGPARIIVPSFLIFLSLRYLIWRILFTLNLDNPINSIFSIVLLGMETIGISISIFQLLLIFTLKNRHLEANHYSQAVIDKQYLPTVDILIPTYNEAPFILRRSVVGCQRMDYPYKRVYILDDTDREEIKNLALELGCEYIARRDNKYAKAGNLNNALKQTEGELVTVFDADFIPSIDFLERVVGFFQNPRIALVQTNQGFYNTDAISRNLKLGGLITPEEESFHRFAQPIKDGIGGTICAGTSFVARRKHLEEVHYFVTESISEDYFTSVKLCAAGYEVIYLNEKLSAGLLSETIPAYINQRLRWARGTLQGLFLDVNPLTIKGLTFRQRLTHLHGYLTWFESFPRVFYLLLPLIYFCFNIVPFRITTGEIIYIWLPLYVGHLVCFNWVNFRSRSVIFSEVYTIILCFINSLTVVKILLNPFSEGFRVTPKGIFKTRFVYHWHLAIPLIIFALITAVNCFLNWGSLNLGLLWGVYNLIFLGIGLSILFDAPQSSYDDVFPVDYAVRINGCYEGRARQLSEMQGVIQLGSNIDFQENITIEFLETGLKVRGQIVKCQKKNEGYEMRVRWVDLTIAWRRQLIEMIFCRHGQWENKQTPGELHSIWLLCRSTWQRLRGVYRQTHLALLKR